MKAIINFKDIAFNSTQGDIIQEWIIAQIEDRSPDNLSPLRYADSVEFSE